jgi:tRNA U34 5-methylaminomethyl-2-thiouridine-forming methyltransferase MnmC
MTGDVFRADGHLIDALTAERDLLRRVVRTVHGIFPRVMNPDLWDDDLADTIRRALKENP